MGASEDKNDQVEIRPPQFPSMTTYPKAAARAVSLATFMAAQALPEGETDASEGVPTSGSESARTKSSETECTSHDEEDGSVPSLGVLGGKEDDIADHHQRCAAEHDDTSALDFHRDVGELSERPQFRVR